MTKKETLGASPPERWFKKPSSMVFPPEKWNVSPKAKEFKSLSAGQVSEITKDLKEYVGWFRTRPYRKEFPIIWLSVLKHKKGGNFE